MAQGRDIAIIIFEKLKGRILSLEYEPGRDLPESELLEEFHASRTPVRSALRRLSDMGLVDILPYQDSKVSLINFDKVKEIIYARASVECSVIKDFMEMGNQLLIEDAEHLVRKQRIVLSSPDFRPTSFYELDSQMHGIWFTSTGKKYIWEFFESQVDYVRTRMMDVKETKDYDSIINDHKMIIERIKAGNLDGMQEIIHKHLNDGIIRLSSRFSQIQQYFC